MTRIHLDRDGLTAHLDTGLTWEQVAAARDKAEQTQAALDSGDDPWANATGAWNDLEALLAHVPLGGIDALEDMAAELMSVIAEMKDIRDRRTTRKPHPAEIDARTYGRD